MKTKIFLYMSLFMGLAFTACNDDDDYFINTDPIIGESSVVTGSADVTATSATLFGTVDGLENSAPSSYTVGFNYGLDQANLNQSVNGSLVDGVVTATITGLTEGTTIYYQSFARLQGKVTFTGEVKSLVTTDATVSTADAAQVDFASALLGGSATGATADATTGIVISTSSDVESVRAGLIVPSAGTDNSVTVNGLVPSTVYYYAAYLDLGTGIVYGPVKNFTTSEYNFDIDNDLVDLGLSVKWARYNVGAKSETDLGGLYGFGDVDGVHNSFDPADYASADIYKTKLDVANKAFGGKVTLPTAADFEELFSLCTSEWTTQDGVAGYKLTGPNGNSIFLPAAGSRTINTVEGQGTTGIYMTGTVNASNNQYAVAYQFTSGDNARTSTPVYQALSARAVSTARNVAFNKSLLCKTWEIDYNKDTQKSVIFNGPVWFMGVDDSWRTVTNGEPVVGDSWLWDADATNTWAFGDCTGYMTFTEDGKVIVKNQNNEEVTGEYTIDYNNYTITSTVDLLAPDNFSGDVVKNRSKSIKILSLEDNKLQLGYFRDSEPATLSVNLIPQNKKYGFAANLLCVGADWGGTWGSELASIMPMDLDGKHTLRYEGSCNGAMVFTLDFAGLTAKNPGVIVTITDIRCDGKSIPFDANKMFYGDIEDNGGYRIELFNIWGKGSVDGKVDSPFSNTVGDSDPNFNFAESIEFDVYINTNPTYTPNLVTINPDWGGTWGFNQGASFNVVVDSNKKLAVTEKNFDITYESGDHAAGSIMTFLQIDGIHDAFPGLHATLTDLVLDGTAVTGWDPAKVVDTADGSAYRLELWNCFGATGHDNSDNCAFGKRNGDVIKELGFTKSMQTKFTIESLFDTPKF